MKTKLTAASLLIWFLSATFLINCAGPVAGTGDASQRASERQDRRAHRRAYGIDRGFTGHYGH